MPIKGKGYYGRKTGNRLSKKQYRKHLDEQNKHKVVEDAYSSSSSDSDDAEQQKKKMEKLKSYGRM